MTVKQLVVVGSGTAGLINALTLKSCFGGLEVICISSEDIGIIGVGEGSTEHWTTFEKFVGIDRKEMVRETEATFKFGIRFSGWTNHTPDYFHSISGDYHTQVNFPGGYVTAHVDGRQLTPTFGFKSLVRNYVADVGDNILEQTNQFHFDTFKLNAFLRTQCEQAGVIFIEGKVDDVSVSSTYGNIEALILDDGRMIDADFVVDASGFSRAVIGLLDEPKWESFSDFLPTDSAIVFQTPEDIKTGIKPYTLATAMTSGWMWEIPTLTRRGNGYVFSSSHISDDDARIEASQVSGFEVPEDARIIRFSPGVLRNSWQRNCVAVGLSSNFVEPLEATSIAASVNQSFLLSSYLSSYETGDTFAEREYTRVFNMMIDNLCAMVALHYVSDRVDSDMWAEQRHRPKPELVERLIEIGKYRGFERHDFTTCGYELFGEPHFWHVAQGQGIISVDGCRRNLDLRGTGGDLRRQIASISSSQSELNFIPHKSALLKGTQSG
jgi:tryptophan halogenase